MWDIPRDKWFPPDSVQCDDCGGHGCVTCDNTGWLTPSTHPKGRRCSNDFCVSGPGRTLGPIKPDCVAVYCCSECAIEDA